MPAAMPTRLLNLRREYGTYVMRSSSALLVASCPAMILIGVGGAAGAAWLTSSGALAAAVATCGAAWVALRSVRAGVVVDPHRRTIVVNRFRTTTLPPAGISFALVDLSVLKPSAKVLAVVHDGSLIKIEASVAYTARRRRVVAADLARVFGGSIALDEYRRAEF